MPRSSKIFKKRLCRNKNRNNNSIVLESAIEVDDNLQSDRSRPSVHVTSPVEDEVMANCTASTEKIISSSRKKLFQSLQDSAETLSSPENGVSKDLKNRAKLTAGSVLLEIENLSNALCSFAPCKSCGSTNCLQCYENLSKRDGLSSELVFICMICGYKHTFFTSKKTQSGYECNLRYVYGLRLIGKGQAAGKTLCSILNLPKPPSRFTSYNKALAKVVQEVAQDSMSKAVCEAVELNDGSTDLAMALDGTWQKRGHTSLNGVVTITSVETGKVCDIECLTKYCQGCKLASNKEGNENHKENCVSNYEGTCGGMEVAGAVAIFNRSIPNYGVRYIKYLGDGDSKGFKKVLESEPYGPDIQIDKLECVGHIQKRMGARLRRLRKEFKGKKLEDGHLLSGRGRLTDSEIDKLQNYFGMAIRNNLESVDKMKTAVWATYFHKLSTNDNPQHGLCPEGVNSWCKYQKSKVTGERYDHKNNLPTAIMTLIKPIFKDLAQPELLKKCLHGRTQNPNESINAVIWTRLPKTVFVGFNTLQLGVFDAVLSFNEGNCGKINVLKKLMIEPGYNTIARLRAIDLDRVQQADAAVEHVTKEARKRKRNKKRKQDDSEVNNQTDYGAELH